MSIKKPLFYNQIAALSQSNYGAFSLDEKPDFRFAKDANSVPLGVSEFATACQVFPIVFLQEQGEAVPVVVLDIYGHSNRWVDAQGHWLGRYIPAYIRRYPFIVVKTSQTESVLCIDQESTKLNRDGRGAPLFEADKPSAVLEQAREFASAYESQLQRNHYFSELLHKYDLLEPMQLQAQTGAKKALLAGFFTVSRLRLEQLESDAVLELQKAGALELIYQHLLSLQQFEQLASQPDTADQLASEGAA